MPWPAPLNRELLSCSLARDRVLSGNPRSSLLLLAGMEFALVCRVTSTGKGALMPQIFFSSCPKSILVVWCPTIWGTERPRRVFLKHFILRPQVLKHERLSDTSAQRLATLLPFLFFKDAVKPPRRCVFSRRPYSTTNHSPRCHILLEKWG